MYGIQKYGILSKLHNCQSLDFFGHCVLFAALLFWNFPSLEFRHGRRVSQEVWMLRWSERFLHWTSLRKGFSFLIRWRDWNSQTRGREALFDLCRERQWRAWVFLHWKERISSTQLKLKDESVISENNQATRRLLVLAGLCNREPRFKCLPFVCPWQSAYSVLGTTVFFTLQTTRRACYACACCHFSLTSSRAPWVVLMVDNMAPTFSCCSLSFSDSKLKIAEKGLIETNLGQFSISAQVKWGLWKNDISYRNRLGRAE